MEGDSHRPVPVDRIAWKIERKGPAWVRGEVRERYHLTPEKIELIEGKLFWTEHHRLMMLALLLENIGVDKAVRLGDAEVWRQALAHRDEPMVLDDEKY